MSLRVFRNRSSRPFSLAAIDGSPRVVDPDSTGIAKVSSWRKRWDRGAISFFFAGTREVGAGPVALQAKRIRIGPDASEVAVRLEVMCAHQFRSRPRGGEGTPTLRTGTGRL